MKLLHCRHCGQHIAEYDAGKVTFYSHNPAHSGEIELTDILAAALSDETGARDLRRFFETNERMEFIVR
jgi:hypothetical protein